MLFVDRIQFGEEEIPIGCEWDQSTGRSADKHGADVHAAVCVSFVPGQYPWVPSQTAKGIQNITHTHTHW